MRITDQRFDRILETIDAICRSPAVRCFRIGYTGRSIQARSDQYYGTEWNHLVALADKLNQEEALGLERDLFEQIRDREDMRTVVYCKYDQQCLEGPYRRSSGGTADDGQEMHTVYMAWSD